MPFLSPSGVSELGFASVGRDVSISDRCSIYGAHAISLGDRVRIDDFAIVTAREQVTIGCYVHISAFAFVGGTFGVSVGDFANVGIRATVLSAADDFSGHWLAGAAVPEDLRHVHGSPVTIGRFALVGTGSLILPSVTLAEGAAVGALSLVKTSLEPWTIYAGIPARRIAGRKRNAEALASDLLSREHPS